MSDRKINRIIPAQRRITRRDFLVGSLAGLGIGAMGFQSHAAQSVIKTLKGGTQAGLKYEVRDIRLLVENGGQTDWAKHDPELITYCRLEEDGYWDIWTIRTDGSENTPVTVNKPGTPKKNNANPGWHPSGKYILFQGEKERNVGTRFHSHPGMGGFCDVWLAKSDGSRFWQITDLKCALTAQDYPHIPVRGVLMPKFSHSGKMLHWSEWRNPGPKGEKGWWWEMKVADFIDDEQNPHVENVRTYNPGPGPFKECFMFTPDDRKLLFAGNLEAGLPEHAMDLYLLDLETGDYENLTKTDTIWEEGCKMSPDGKKIFFGSNEGYEDRIDPKNTLASRWADYWIMDADGSNKKRLTWLNEPGHPHYMAGQTHAAVVSWSPDGRRLSACTGTGGKLQVRIIELN